MTCNQLTLCFPQLRNNSALAVEFSAQLASLRPPRPQDDADWVALLLSGSGDPRAWPTVGKKTDPPVGGKLLAELQSKADMQEHFQESFGGCSRCYTDTVYIKESHSIYPCLFSVYSLFNCMVYCCMSYKKPSNIMFVSAVSVNRKDVSLISYRNPELQWAERVQRRPSRGQHCCRTVPGHHRNFPAWPSVC